MTTFNLVDQPWVPVLYGGATSGTQAVGLEKLFTEADRICALGLPPLERVAVLRLLICITQAALDGPKNDDDWLNCGDRIQCTVLKYLKKWKNRFDLFGPRPFLQVPDAQPATKDLWPVDALHLAYSTGNAHTLFDHAALGPPRTVTPAELATFLLTYQSFHPGGLLNTALWNGIQTPRSSTQAPCVEGSALLAFLLGDNLLETIHLNLLPKSRLDKNPFGRPIWEYDSPPKPGTPDAEEFRRSYLGRLVPFARVIRVFWVPPDPARCLITKGLDYPKLPDSREPAATVVLRSGKTEWTYLRINPDRHPWRELHSVLALQAINEPGGPLCLYNVLSLARNRKSLTIDLWLTGLAADQAKLLDVREWLFSFTPDLLEKNNLETYKKGVAFATALEGQLREAVRAYCHFLKLETAGYTGRAVAIYWSTLDNHYQELLNCAEKQQELDAWKRRCRAAAHAAYRDACPAETPRQIEAFVEGYRVLLTLKKKKGVAQ
jgi:CRISPR system Cascade subunit CasA